MMDLLVRSVMVTGAIHAIIPPLSEGNPCSLHDRDVLGICPSPGKAVYPPLDQDEVYKDLFEQADKY
jgi:hypothetical protein